MREHPFYSTNLVLEGHFIEKSWQESRQAIREREERRKREQQQQAVKPPKGKTEVITIEERAVDETEPEPKENDEDAPSDL